MNTKIISDMEGFRGLQEDWESLEQRDPDCTYYSTFQYNYAWWETYGSDASKELFIICSYRDNHLVGIAPLMIRHTEMKGLKFHVLCFLGKGDYFTFIVDKKDPTDLKIYKSLFAAIEEHADRWDKCELTHMANDTQLLYYLLRHDKYNPHISYLTSCPTVKLSEYSNFEDFMKARVYSRAKKTNEKFRREFPYQLKVFYGCHNDDLYHRIAQVHRQEKEYLQIQKGRSERQSIFEDKQNEVFFKKHFKENRQVVTFLLEDEAGDIIIYRVCYLYKKTLHGWNTGYSPKYSQFHSLADVLMLEMIRYLYEQGVGNQIDFGAGSYPWKFKWTNQFKVNYSLTLWNMSKNRVKLYRWMASVNHTIRAVRRKGYAH